MFSFQTYETRATPASGFSLSPCRRRENYCEGFGAYDPLRWTNPPPLPGEGEATGTRAQGRFDFAQLTH